VRGQRRKREGDVTDPDLRASHADREQVVAALQRHTAAGRLTLDEFGERVDRALAAVTRSELAAVTRDLPTEPGPNPQTGPAFQHHQLSIAFLLAALTLIILGVVLAIAR
jgi:hypothetical protein